MNARRSPAARATSSNPHHVYVGMHVDGVCATTGHTVWGGSGLIGDPVYRLWNGKPDTNHRFVTDKAERDAMIARGWIPEGAGLDGIAMCAWAIEPPLADQYVARPPERSNTAPVENEQSSLREPADHRRDLVDRRRSGPSGSSTA